MKQAENVSLREKIIALLDKIDDYEILLFVCIILEDALQWQQVTGIGV